MNNWNSPKHSYEELRDAIVDALLGDGPPDQWVNLTNAIQNNLNKKSGSTQRLHPQDLELIRDVFWDLFRQGYITLGLNDSNPNWPFFRLSHFGQQTLASQQPYRFHNTASYIKMVQKEIPDILPQTISYLDEAVAAFYAGCMLASCVMLGVAAEVEFLRLLDVAASNQQYKDKFSQAQNEKFIRQKINKFHASLKVIAPSLDNKATEDLETNLTAIQSVLRIARNEAGHPSSANPQREQVFVFLQLFIPFAKQLLQLRKALE